MGAAVFAHAAAAATALALLAGAGTARAQTAPAAAPPDGATLFRQQCSTCHTLDPSGPSHQGPHLQGVVGRQAGKVAGFRYSPNLASADWTWDEAKLDAYLTNPQNVVKGGIMPYRQGRAEVRSGVIEYLKTQGAAGNSG